MDHVPIRPRFQENEVDNVLVATPSVAPVQNLQVNPPPVPQSKGLFTSAYDNKLIVLIIVIVIIIIALVAYVIYRKEESEVPKPRPRRNNYQQDNIAKSGEGNSDRGGAGEEKSTAVVAENTDKQTTTHVQDINQENLKNLLARGRATVASVSDDSKIQTKEEYDDEKTETEILHLMEDDINNQLDNDNNDGDNTHEDANAGTLVTPADNPTEENSLVTPADQASTSNLDPNKCSVLVKGVQCKNRVTVNGKCRVHSKK